jgi:hypothetical protein
MVELHLKRVMFLLKVYGGTAGKMMDEDSFE